MPRILLVEDDEINRDIMARRLSREGYSVLPAATGEEALNLATTERPDVILLDIKLALTDMDGWEVIRQLRANPTTQTLPIIALTAYSMPEDRDKALQTGCNDFHAKPIEFARLIKQIAALLPKGEAS